MKKFISQHGHSILVFMHFIFMLVAFLGFAYLIGVYIYDWARDSVNIRKNVAYENIDSMLDKLAIFSDIDEKINIPYIYSDDKKFVHMSEIMMMGDSNINGIRKVRVDNNNNYLSELEIIKEKGQNFYVPITIWDKTKLGNSHQIKIFHNAKDYNEGAYEQIYLDQNFDKYHVPNYRTTYHSQQKNILESLEIFDPFNLNDGEHVIIVVDLDSNYLLERLKGFFGENFDFFIIDDDNEKLYFHKNSVLESIGSNSMRIGSLQHFNYAGSEYTVSYHEISHVEIGVVAPSYVYFDFDKPADNKLIILLLFAMFLTSSLTSLRFRRLRRNVGYHVRAILNNQQIFTHGKGLDKDIAQIKDNFIVLNRYMPNNFRNFELTTEKDFSVRRQEICIMFIQLELSGETPAQDELPDWNTHYQSIIPCIVNTGGIIDKLMGDVILAVWQDKPDHLLVLEACKAALGIQNLFKDTAINVQIGINIGTCDVGSYGNDVRAEYTISGTPVNLTSRICKITKEYGASILLSEYVYDCLDHVYHTRLVDAVIAYKTRKGFYLYELLPENKELEAINSIYIKEFRHAFALYQSKQWKEALLYFETLENKYQDNKIIKRFIHRIKTKAVPENWQGYWQL